MPVNKSNLFSIATFLFSSSKIPLELKYLFSCYNDFITYTFGNVSNKFGPFCSDNECHFFIKIMEEVINVL